MSDTTGLWIYRAVRKDISRQRKDGAKIYLESWRLHPAKTLGPQSTAFMRKLILGLGGEWPDFYPQELREEATIEAHKLLAELVRSK